MSEINNSFGNSYKTAPEQNYSMDLSQFDREWVDEPPRKTEQERGGKTWDSITFSSNTQDMDDTASNGYSLYGSLRGLTPMEKPSKKNQPEKVASKKEEISRKNGSTEKVEEVQKVGKIDSRIIEAVADEMLNDSINKSKIAPEPVIPEEPKDNIDDAKTHRQKLIDELFPMGVHDSEEAKTEAGGRFKGPNSPISRSRSETGRHFAPKDDPRYLGGKHFAKKDDPRYLEKTSRGERGRHFAESERIRERQKTLNRVRSSESYKKSRMSKIIAYILLTATLLAGGLRFANTLATALTKDDFNSAVKSSAMSKDEFDSTIAENYQDSKESEQNYNSLTGYKVLDKRIDGSFEQFEFRGKPGSPNAIANTDEILKLMNIDPAEATAEEYGAVYKFLAYSMAPVAAGAIVERNVPGFENLTINEIEEKIYGMNVAEKADFQKELSKILDSAKFSYKMVSGNYFNQGDTPSDKVNRYFSYFAEVKRDNYRLVMVETPFDGGVKYSFFDPSCGNLQDLIISVDENGEVTDAQIVTTKIDPSPEPTPKDSTDPEKPEKPGTPTDDSKNADAIRRNMDHEGRVKPMDSGDLSERPDTSRDSYQDELRNAEEAKEKARSEKSESEGGGTIGDAIDNSDQTYANHGNYTQEQLREKDRQAEAEARQEEADVVAEQMKGEAEQKANMSEADTAQWFNSTISMGGE